MSALRRAAAGALAALRSATQSAPPQAAAASSASLVAIEAVPRERTGAKFAARERAGGRVPTVVVSPPTAGAITGADATKKLILTADAQKIGEILEKSPYFYTTPIKLEVRAGVGSSVLLQSGSVLPIKVHQDKETGKVLNLVLAWAESGTELKVDVPVVFTGEDSCPGLKKGGFLRKIRSTIKYLCPAEQIPSKVVVDVSNLDIGDKVSMEDLNVNASAKLLSKNNAVPVCKIIAETPAEPKLHDGFKVEENADQSEATDAEGITEAEPRVAYS